MSIFDLLTPNVENRGVTIGKAEATKENLASMFMGIMSSMGLSNPQGVTSTSSKAVTVTKKGQAYIITLNQYDPPLTFTWTGLLPTDKVVEVIEKLIVDKKKINYVNNVETDKGKFVQFGVS